MYFLLLAFWIILNGRFTVEILILAAFRFDSDVCGRFDQRDILGKSYGIKDCMAS